MLRSGALSRRRRRPVLRAFAASLAFQAVGPASALAHHGYDWLDPRPFVLVGVVEDVYLGNPHGFLMVRAADGVWEVELSDPPAHERAGFGAESARVGDTVRAEGHRGLDPREPRMRGDKLTVNGATYDIFPASVFALAAVNPTGITRWLLALQNWSVAERIRASLWLYPIVNATHILGIALLIGAIMPLDLRLLGLFGRRGLGELAGALVPVSAVGLVVAVGAGFLLFTVKPLEYAENPAFLTKIALVALGTANAAAVRTTGAWRLAVTGGSVKPWLKAAAALSALVWVAALLSGRLIAFLD